MAVVSLVSRKFEDKCLVKCSDNIPVLGLWPYSIKPFLIWYQIHTRK